MLDEDGKTRVQPFNFMTETRPERLKDKREGQIRASIDATAASTGFGLKKIQPNVVSKERQSPLARKVQQAGRGGQSAYQGPDVQSQEKLFKRQFPSFGKQSHKRSDSQTSLETLKQQKQEPSPLQSPPSKPPSQRNPIVSKLSDQDRSSRNFSKPEPKPPIKLFDVDVKVSADTIVSIEITD